MNTEKKFLALTPIDVIPNKKDSTSIYISYDCCMMVLNSDLFEHLYLHSTSINDDHRKQMEDCLFKYLMDEGQKVDQENLKTKISTFIFTLIARWKKAHRSLNYFKTKNESWLNSPFMVPTLAPDVQSRGGGRPRLSFDESSERTKRRKLETKYSDVPSGELLRAAHWKLVKEGKRKQANLILQASTPEGTEGILSLMKKAKEIVEVKPYSATAATALLMQRGMSKRLYQFLRNDSKVNCGTFIYPSYNDVLEEKKKCYPPGIEISNKGAFVPLKDLLHHTAKRILENLVDSSIIPNEVRMICKYGCDGSGNHPSYMQKSAFLTEEDDNKDIEESFNVDDLHEALEECTNEMASADKVSDSNLLLFALVPLCVQTSDNDTIWINETPNSPRFCRPIQFLYCKENNDVVVREIAKLRREISSLDGNDLEIIVNDRTISCSVDLHCTMCDQKTVNCLTGTKSTQTCHLCRSTPTEVNKLDLVKQKPIIHDNLQYGLATLHGWVKLMEYVVHISYKDEIKKPTIRGLSVVQKKQYNERCQLIRDKLEELGLLFDRIVLGKGTSNTGNLARRFFRNYCGVAQATGVKEDCIRRLYIVIIALTCNKSLNITAFEEYLHQTATLFVEEYPWYYMPVSVHKLLMHSVAVIKEKPLPIGFFSEEAIEASNKVYRRVREHHTRKDARKHTIRDVLQYMLVYSDPFLSSLSPVLATREVLELPEEVKNLLNDDLSSGANAENDRPTSPTRIESDSEDDFGEGTDFESEDD